MSTFLETEGQLIITRLKEICLEASTAIMAIYEQDFEVFDKEDASPLTLADKRSNEIICNNLKKWYPDIPIISEEKTNESVTLRAQYTYCWIVDPLDGTKEFVAKNGEFAINIALAYKGVPVLGIVALPYYRQMYTAIKGQGAYRSTYLGEVEPIQCGTYDLDAKHMRVLVSRSHINSETQALLATLDEPRILPAGSALKFLKIAEGLGDYYPRLGPTMEWDTAAPQII